jgi:hypothetical protein
MIGYKMSYPQSTLEEIIDSERAMILDAPKRYGPHRPRGCWASTR